MKISRLTLACILFTSIIILWPILALISLPEGNNFAEHPGFRPRGSRIAGLPGQPGQCARARSPGAAGPQPE